MKNIRLSPSLLGLILIALLVGSLQRGQAWGAEAMLLPGLYEDGIEVTATDSVYDERIAAATDSVYDERIVTATASAYDERIAAATASAYDERIATAMNLQRRTDEIIGCATMAELKRRIEEEGHTELSLLDDILCDSYIDIAATEPVTIYAHSYSVIIHNAGGRASSPTLKLSGPLSLIGSGTLFRIENGALLSDERVVIEARGEDAQALSLLGGEWTPFYTQVIAEGSGAVGVSALSAARLEKARIEVRGSDAVGVRAGDAIRLKLSLVQAEEGAAALQSDSGVIDLYGSGASPLPEYAAVYPYLEPNVAPMGFGPAHYLIEQGAALALNNYKEIEFSFLLSGLESYTQVTDDILVSWEGLPDDSSQPGTYPLTARPWAFYADMEIELAPFDGVLEIIAADRAYISAATVMMMPPGVRIGYYKEIVDAERIQLFTSPNGRDSWQELDPDTHSIESEFAILRGLTEDQLYYFQILVSGGPMAGYSNIFRFEYGDIGGDRDGGDQGDQGELEPPPGQDEEPPELPPPPEPEDDPPQPSYTPPLKPNPPTRVIDTLDTKAPPPLTAAPAEASEATEMSEATEASAATDTGKEDKPSLPSSEEAAKGAAEPSQDAEAKEDVEKEAEQAAREAQKPLVAPPAADEGEADVVAAGEASAASQSGMVVPSAATESLEQQPAAESEEESAAQPEPTEMPDERAKQPGEESEASSAETPLPAAATAADAWTLPGAAAEASPSLQSSTELSSQQLNDLLQLRPRQLVFVEDGLKLILPSEAAERCFGEAAQLRVELCWLDEQRFLVRFWDDDTELSWSEEEAFLVQIPLAGLVAEATELYCLDEQERRYEAVPAIDAAEGSFAFALPSGGIYSLGGLQRADPDSVSLNDAASDPAFPQAAAVSMGLAAITAAAAIVFVRRVRMQHEKG